MEIDGAPQVYIGASVFFKCICYQDNHPEFRGTLTLTNSKVYLYYMGVIICSIGWMEDYWGQ